MKEEYAIDIVELLIDTFEKATAGQEKKQNDCEITIIFGESGKLKQICMHTDN